MHSDDNDKRYVRIDEMARELELVIHPLIISTF